MASPKCRLEVWKPKIRIVQADGSLLGLYEPLRWIACETHEDIDTNQRRGNALESTSLSDRVFEPMMATMRVTNRPQDFKSYDADVYKHLYKDSDGVAIDNYPSYPGTLSGGQVYLRKRWGAFTNFFYEFQHVRIVDLESHLVLFAGRITKITKRYEDGNGSIVQLEARDALNDIANITTSALVKSATFGTSRRRSDLIKYMLRLATDYGANQPPDGPSVDVVIGSGDIATIANISSGILTNADIGTSDVINQFSRFERSAQAFRRDTKWNAEMTGTKHVLAEICRWAMLDPHNSNTSERAFGYDLFVDANYGKKNLNATIGPGVSDFNAPHFNYFKRGNRLSAAGGAGQDAAVYGLTVKYPTITTATRVGATAINVGELGESINATVTTFEITNDGIVPGIQIQIGSEYMYVKQVMPDVTGGGGGDELEVLRGFASTTAAIHSVNADISNPRSAQTVMQRGFNFEDSKEDLYTEAVLTYNVAKDNVDTNDVDDVQENTATHFKLKRMEIMYVTEVALGTSPDTDTQFHWDGLNIDDERKSVGTTTAEWVDVYNAAGAKQEDEVARIQYQSHSALTGSTNFAFILLSNISSDFPTGNYGSDAYVELRGVESGAKCRLNLATGLTEAHEGRPSKVWGTHRVFDMGQMSDEDTTDLRAEIASRLAQATTGLRQGSYSFSRAPYYWWDGLVRSVGTATAGVSFGQDITVKNVNDSAAINITNFGVREGMLVHKMTANHAAIAQNGGDDVYGYIGDMQDNQTIAVRLAVRHSSGSTTVSTFAVGDPIRIIIPVRAGTEVFVDNVIAEIYGEHIVSKIEYNEDPMPETRIISIGKNETRLGGGHRVKGLISSIAQTALAAKEKSKILQPQTLGSLFGALTITMPNGSEAHTALKATWGSGSLKMVDGQVFNFAAGSTAHATYGLNGNMVATQHYVVYLDPDGENLPAGGTYNLYTKRVGAYIRDSDNIPVFRILPSTTAGVTKPIIQTQPNIWLSTPEAFSLKNEATAIIENSTIITNLIENSAITTLKINALAVDSGRILDYAITSNKITNGTIEGKTFVDTGFEIASGGYIRTENKDSFTDTTAGFWLGRSGSTFALNIGDVSNYLKWDGSTLAIKGIMTIDSGTMAGLTLSASELYFGVGDHGGSNTGFYVNSSGNFSLGANFVWTASSATLVLKSSTSNARVEFSGDGLKAYNSSNAEVTIIADDSGLLTAKGGSFRSNNTVARASTPVVSTLTGTGVIVDNLGIIGGVSGAAQFYISASDGKAYFGGGVCTISNAGIHFPPTSTNTNGGAIEWEYGSASTWLYRGAGTNVVRWTTTASTPAAGAMELLSMDLKLLGGDVFVYANGAYANLAPLYGGTDSDADALHTHDDLGGVTSVTAANSITVSSSTGSVTIGHNSTPGAGHQHVLGYTTGSSSPQEGQVMTISDGGHLVWADQGGGGGSGDITGVNISAHTGLTGTVNTTSGQHTQTITHLDTNGFQHIPEDGVSGQVLTWDEAGTAEWTIPSAHGNHGGSGGSHDHSSSYSFSSNNISAVGNITVTGEYKGAAGSASSPTYTFTNDTDAGMWYGSGSGGTGVGISKGGSQILKLSNGAYITGYLNATVFPVGNEIDVSWSSSDNYIYKASSSRASKMNIRELDIDSSKLYDLELKSFDFRKANMDTGGFLDEPGQASFGMIAEDVFPIIPNLVNLNKDGEPEAIQYKLLSVLLLAELKKLRTRIEVLEGNG